MAQQGVETEDTKFHPFGDAGLNQPGYQCNVISKCLTSFHAENSRVFQGPSTEVYIRHFPKRIWLSTPSSKSPQAMM
jgi:hypothetical protein